MTYGAVWEIGLQNRKAKIEELQKEQEELEKSLGLAEFEEDMYHNLAERRPHYKDVFEQKRIVSEEVCNQLEEKQNALNKEVEIINIEIDYIKEKIRLGTR